GVQTCALPISSGGGTTATSSSGGGTSRSTSSGGGSTRTSSAGGDHRHVMFTETSASGPIQPRRYNAASGGLAEISASSSTLTTAGSSGNHSHSVSVPALSHDFSTPNHTHTVDVPNHSHTVNIPAHKHEISLPDHTHAIDHGIYKLNRRPSKVTIRVDGNTVSFSNTSADSLDLIPHLETNSDNRIKRGWHTVEIAPNDLGRITAELLVQFFIQSRGGVDA